MGGIILSPVVLAGHRAAYGTKAGTRNKASGHGEKHPRISRKTDTGCRRLLLLTWLGCLGQCNMLTADPRAALW